MIYSDVTEHVKGILLNNKEYFHNSNPISFVFRWIGWGLINLLKLLCNLMQSLWNACLEVLDFTDVISQNLGTWRPIWYAVLLVTIIAVGVLYLYSEYLQIRRPQFLKNIAVTMAVAFLLPSAVSLGKDLIYINRDALIVDNGSLADNIIKENVTDLSYIYSKGWDFSGDKNAISADQISTIDVTETEEYGENFWEKAQKFFGGSSGDDKEVFRYQMVTTENGDIKFLSIDKQGIFKLKPWYYRYDVNWLRIMFQLIVETIVLCLFSYKTFRLVWEIIFGELLTYVLSGNVASGERTKQLLQNLLNLFWCLCILIWGFYIWTMFQGWISDKYSDINLLAPILTLFAGFAVADGPDIVEKIFGYDIGVKDGAEKYALLRSGGNLAEKAACHVAQAVQKVHPNANHRENEEGSAGKAQEPPDQAGQNSAGKSKSSGGQVPEPPGSANPGSASEESGGSETAEKGRGNGSRGETTSGGRRNTGSAAGAGWAGGGDTSQPEQHNTSQNNGSESHQGEKGENIRNRKDDQTTRTAAEPKKQQNIAENPTQEPPGKKSTDSTADQSSRTGSQEGTASSGGARRGNGEAGTEPNGKHNPEAVPKGSDSGGENPFSHEFGESGESSGGGSEGIAEPSGRKAVSPRNSGTVSTEINGESPDTAPEAGGSRNVNSSGSAAGVGWTGGTGNSSGNVSMPGGSVTANMDGITGSSDSGSATFGSVTETAEPKTTRTVSGKRKSRSSGSLISAEQSSPIGVGWTDETAEKSTNMEPGKPIETRESKKPKEPPMS